MGKKVIISVKGIKTTGKQGTDALELVTEGVYYKKGNTYYVSYKESEVTGMDGTTTTLKIEDGIVTLLRFGSVNTQFIFEKGRRHLSYYDTAYGTFTIGVTANKVNIDIDDAGGEVRVDYNLEVDNNKSGNNDFHMFIREGIFDEEQIHTEIS